MYETNLLYNVDNFNELLHWKLTFIIWGPYIRLKFILRVHIWSEYVARVFNKHFQAEFQSKSINLFVHKGNFDLFVFSENCIRSQWCNWKKLSFPNYSKKSGICLVNMYTSRDSIGKHFINTRTATTLRRLFMSLRIQQNCYRTTRRDASRSAEFIPSMRALTWKRPQDSRFYDHPPARVSKHRRGKSFL